MSSRVVHLKLTLRAFTVVALALLTAALAAEAQEVGQVILVS